MSLAASIGAGACLTRLASPVAEAGVLVFYGRGVPSMCVTWFPPDELPRALQLWPDMVEWDFVDHADYSRHVEATLRRLAGAGSHDLGVSPIRVADYVSWCEEVSDQADDAASRARYAAVVGMRGDAVEWPPNDDAPCWCRSGAPYIRCCGAPPNDSSD